MSIVDKLRSINTIKNEIKTAIKNKGVAITDSTPFSEYPSKITAIIAGEPPDTVAPVIEIFNMVVNPNRSVSMNGKSEIGATVVLKNPSNVVVPVTVNPDGTFTALINSPAPEGVYTLSVSDKAGNTTYATKQITLPPFDYALTLFNLDSKGVYYDFADLNTIFQDVEGTIPVTAVGQTVACIKDKSGKGWSSEQPTVSKQPKVGYNSTTKAHTLMFDRIDDVLTKRLATDINMPDITIIVAAAHTSFMRGNVDVSITAGGGWGFGMYASNSNQLMSGVLYSSGSFSINAQYTYTDATNPPEVIVLTSKYGGEVKVSNGIKSNTAPSQNTFNPNLNTFTLGIANNGNLYKVLIINRILTQTEINGVRAQFNRDLGIV